MSDDKPRGARASYSSTFAAVAALTLLTFVVAIGRSVLSLHYWSLWFILVWAVMLAIGLIIWAARPLKGPLGGHRIGGPTLGMVAGVSAGAIAAVALALQVASTVDQTHMIEQQNALLREQVDTTKMLDEKLARIEEALTVSDRMQTRRREDKPDNSLSSSKALKRR